MEEEEGKGSISQVPCSAVAVHLTQGLLLGKEGERAALDLSLVESAYNFKATARPPRKSAGGAVGNHRQPVPS